MDNNTYTEEELRQLGKRIYEKIKWTIRHDRLLYVALILTITILGLSLYMQYAIGSTGLDEGVVIHEEKNQTLAQNNFKVFTAKFNLEYNAFSFGSTEKVNIFLLEGNYSTATSATTITDNYFAEKEQTNSWSYFFNNNSVYSIALINTNGKDVQYSITIRDYTASEAQKISNRTLGGLILYASVLPLILYVLIRIFKKYSIIPILIVIGGFITFIGGKTKDTIIYKNKK